MRGNRGYTLTEIIVAVAVIAILAGAMTPLIFKQIERSRTARARQDLDAVRAAFVQYRADTQYWPCGWDASTSNNVHTTFVNFYCLYQDDNRHGWDGPYLDRTGGQVNGYYRNAVYSDGEWQGVVDPWGRPYRVFEANTSTSGAEYGAVVLYSTGKNGRVDTSDADLLLGNASGDDVVLVVTRRAADD